VARGDHGSVKSAGFGDALDTPGLAAA